jgi:hypothetical protein
MSIAEIRRSLSDRGYRFRVRGERLHVKPIPDDATIVELRAQKAGAFVLHAEHGGRWPIPAAKHHRGNGIGFGYFGGSDFRYAPLRPNP